MRSAILSRSLGVALLLIGRVAFAADPVQIDVQVISATTDNKGVDAKLEKLHRRLSELKYSSYTLVSEHTITLTLNQHQTVMLPDQYKLEITPQSIEPSGEIRMHLHVHGAQEKKIVDTEYAITPGGDLLVGGMKHGTGALMVALHHHERP